ncbi:hypothetical protein JCGZ_04838 [Jatropha curcas]|uniref:VQ domain-containing protein n=1 Tax=Jatropha curcas TaxID=180498 RepID=A0A067L140_JATCU|nr:hypothetical protein JCGZ_04838 [Jatropha curcas]
MGKKVSSRIPKNEKKQLMINNLIGELRPKVYITDTSSFKRLVQELTSNRDTILPVQSRGSEMVSVRDTAEVQECNNNLETSVSDGSVDSFDDLQKQEHLLINQTVDGYKDIESWLLDSY